MKTIAKLSISVLLLVVVMIVVAASIPRTARAAGPWYVAPTGSDSNTCLSAVSPCATINGALGKASSGDTIFVAMGTYTSSIGSEVVLINKDVTLSGGWNATFTTQSGMSTINGQGARRGIMVNNGIAVIMDRFTIQNGFSSGSGGGIYSEFGSVTLNNSTVSGNTGVGISSSGVTLNNSTISGNTEGGIYSMMGTITLNRSTVSGNTGNGIYNFEGNATLNNSTVSGNTIPGSFSGGGIYNFLGNVKLNNSTISGNTAGSNGGGIFIDGGTVTLQNTIIANNGTLSGSDCSVGATYGGTINSLGYNLVRHNSNCILAGTDLVNVDPQLGPLQDNGGSTLTQALLPGSPAINAGNPTGCTDSSGVPLPFDQRGDLRVDRCDIGAYEYGSSPLVTKRVAGTFQPGSLVTYTLTFNTVPTADLIDVSLHDSLPAQVTYVPSSLTVTNGSGAVNDGTLIWAGTVFSNTPTVISFGAMISITAQNAFITNKATSSWREYMFSAATTFDTFSNHVYLPLIARNYCAGPFYTDDFSNSASGWPVGDSGNARYEYLSSEYRILLRNTNWSVLVTPGLKASDSIVAVDVRNATAVYGSYGLLFGLSDDFSQFYDFEIDPAGFYAIYRLSSGTLTPLAQGYSASIKTGTATNRLKLERNGSSIKAYANGQLLTSISDGSYTGLRRVGLIAFSYDQPNVDVRFDNFKVYDVTCEAIATSFSTANQMGDAASPTISELSGSGTATPRWHIRLDALSADDSDRRLLEDQSHHQ